MVVFLFSLLLDRIEVNNLVQDSDYCNGLNGHMYQEFRIKSVPCGNPAWIPGTPASDEKVRLLFSIITLFVKAMTRY